MAESQDLSNFAAFDLDDLLAEIEGNKAKKEVTAYLDRSFIAKMINEYNHQTQNTNIEFTSEQKIDFSDYNFTGADLRDIRYVDFALCNFKDCDISSARLDRDGINFFRELILQKTIIAQGLNLEGAYLGPILTIRSEIGIQCYIYLNLSNLDLTGTNFSKCDIEGLILENSNISSCNFIDCLNLNPKQFAFTIGFENAIFSADSETDRRIKDQIKHYSQNLDPLANSEYSSPKQNKFIAYLANITNIFGD
jgi:uncharacterized protein YjbI with pentapeptide repeats